MFCFSTNATIFSMFSTKHSSQPTEIGKCSRVNVFLVAVLESSKPHGIGRESEDAKISRLAILEQSQNFPNLTIHRVLTNDVLNVMQSLSSYTAHGRIDISNPAGDLNQFFDGQDKDVISDSLALPGLLIFTLSDADVWGR